MNRELIVLLAFLGLAYSPFSIRLGYENPFALKHTILALGSLCLLGLMILRGREVDIPRVAWLPVGYLLYLIAQIPWIGPAEIMLPHVFEKACLLVVFVASAQGVGEHDKESILRALMVLGVVVSAWALMQVWVGELPYAMLGNRNFVAAFLLAAIPGAVYFSGRASGGRVWYAMAAAILLAGLFVCQSKAGWVAVLCVGMGTLLFMRRHTIALLATAGLAVTFWLIPPESVVQELSRDIRPYLWDAAWQMGAAHPVDGIGLGRFFAEFPARANPVYYLMNKAADTPMHAHSELLHVFAETGMIGVFFVTVFVFSCLLRRGDERHMVLKAMVLLLLVKTCFSKDLQTVPVQFLLWMGLGLLSAGGPAWSIGRRVLAPLAIVLACGVVLQAWPFAQSQWHMRQATLAKEKADWTSAQGHLRKAFTAQPGNPEIPLRLGYAQARAGLWQEALGSYAAVQRLAPHFAGVEFNMAAAYRQLGDIEMAEVIAETGLQRNPYSLAGHDVMREIHALRGETRKALGRERLIRRLLEMGQARDNMRGS